MKPKAIDLFCGAGGTSTGAKDAGCNVALAVNHWDVAVQTHSANFPDTLHVNSRVEDVPMSAIPKKFQILFASPECTGHSRARGDRPTSDQARCDPWSIMRYLDKRRPSHLIVENVAEFADWGPVGDNGRPMASRKGTIFKQWLGAIEAFGYRVDYHVLNAADFGAATSRKRLFVMARKGNRSPQFPVPTHAKHAGGELPGMGRLPWKAAAEIIDWSIPCRSVFLRKTPLRDKTLARIEAGLRRFVTPYLVILRNNQNAAPVGGPMGTLTAGGGHNGIAVPYQFQLIGRGAGNARDAGAPMPTVIAARETHGVAVPYLTGCGGRAGQSAPGSIGLPSGTITGKADRCLAVPFLSSFHNGPDGANRNYPLADGIPTLDTSNRFALTAPYLVDVNHGASGDLNGRTHPINIPLRTVTGKRGTAVAVPFIVEYYGQGGSQSVGRTLGTVTTHDRCGLCYAVIELAGDIEPRTDGERRLLATMRELGVADIGFRMLSNPELALAQSFPADYVFKGTKAEVTKQIGNAVCPAMAEALAKSALGV